MQTMVNFPDLSLFDTQVKHELKQYRGNLRKVEEGEVDEERVRRAQLSIKN